MKRTILFVLLLSSCMIDAFGQMRFFSIYVENKSGFDIICEGKPVKGGGVFSKYTPLLKKHAWFIFEIQSNKGTLPKGVEGTLRFRIGNAKYPGYAEAYFDNPIVGSPEFSMGTINFPFAAEQISMSQVTNAIPVMVEKAVMIRLYVDTVPNTKPPIPLPVKGSDKPNPKNPTGAPGNLDEPIPEIINFEWEVQQRSRKDDDDDDDNGKAYQEVSYHFTASGDYAAVKPSDKSFSLMIYTPKGHTWLVNDQKKTILVISMPRTVGEEAQMGKKTAERIKKAPLEKDKDDEKFTMTKSGNTKKILGYTAEEYVMKNNKAVATKNAIPMVSFWYAIVPFDPVKIYTMGAGRPADLSKLQNDPRTKNNMTAIPILNKNYLMAETVAGGMKGLETISITHKFFTFRTAGYTIKVAKSIADMIGE